MWVGGWVVVGRGVKGGGSWFGWPSTKADAGVTSLLTCTPARAGKPASVSWPAGSTCERLTPTPLHARHPAGAAVAAGREDFENVMGGFGVGVGSIVEQLADLRLGELLDTPPPGFDEAVAIAKVCVRGGVGVGGGGSPAGCAQQQGVQTEGAAKTAGLDVRALLGRW